MLDSIKTAPAHALVGDLLGVAALSVILVALLWLPTLISGA